MRHLKYKDLSLIGIAVFFFIIGCSDNESPQTVMDPGTTQGDTVSNFSSIDVNPNSSTHNQPVSPRDYLGKISAWYFGHAT